MSNAKALIPFSKVPSARDLSDSLGFCNTKDQKYLRDFLRKWRMKYTTSKCSGTELLDWKFEQEELKIMAKAFLSDAVKQEFWLRRKVVDSSTSYEETVNLLMQLCWKQTKYADNNAKYPQSSQRRIRCMDAREYRRQIKHRKRAGGTLIAYNDDQVMVLETEQNHLSQQLSPAPPPLALLQTDATALPPTKLQPLVQHKSALTTQHKSRILLPFHTLLHNNGVTHQSFWEEGRFGSKSLKEFLPGLAAKLGCELNVIEKIKLVLRLETREVEFEMEATNEDIWGVAMATFRDEIKRAKAKCEVNGASVLVEPVMRRNGAETVGWNEGEDFEL